LIPHIDNNKNSRTCSLSLQICFVVFVYFTSSNCIAVNAEKLCSYQTYEWNTNDKKAIHYQLINKKYKELTADEVDAFTGCSVCEQDQRLINIPTVKPFKVCYIIAPLLYEIITELVNRGQVLNSITGYRVGRTRGDIDEKGNRTKFSNHSYGIAIDVNAAVNGLYDNCLSFNSNCRLIRGGRWVPGKSGSLTKDSETVHALESMGLKWGGVMPGKQKDFMHFSPTGY